MWCLGNGLCFFVLDASVPGCSSPTGILSHIYLPSDLTFQFNMQDCSGLVASKCNLLKWVALFRICWFFFLIIEGLFCPFLFQEWVDLNLVSKSKSIMFYLFISIHGARIQILQSAFYERYGGAHGRSISESAPLPSLFPSLLFTFSHPHLIVLQASQKQCIYSYAKRNLMLKETSLIL